MGYKTKQREYILAFLQNSEGRHITVAELVRHLQDNATPVGTATVYRTLEQLVEEGMVRKYVLDGKSSAYINAAFDIAKGKINGRKTVADQRRQVFNADSANAAVRNVGKKNDPDAARDRMIQRHAGEKED